MSVSREVATITRCCPTPTAFSLLRVLSWFLTDRSSSKPVTSSGIDGSGSLALFGVSIEHPRWPSRSVPPRGPRSAPRFARESGFRSLPRSLPRGLAPEDPRSSRRGRPPPELLSEPAPGPPPELVRRSSPPPGPRRSPPRSGRPDDEPRRGSPSRGRRAGWSSDTGLAPFVVIACRGRSRTPQSYGKRERAPTGCSRWWLFHNVCPAASYSPTPSPVQYHRR